MPFKRLMNEIDKESPDIKVIDEILRHYPSLISKMDEEQGLTPVLLAAFRGKYDLVKHLLSRGAKLTEKSNYLETCFMMAANFGDLTLAKLALLHDVDPLATDMDGANALSYAEDGLSQLDEKYKDLKKVLRSLSAFSVEHTAIKNEMVATEEKQKKCKIIINFIKGKMAEPFNLDSFDDPMTDTENVAMHVSSSFTNPNIRKKPTKTPALSLSKASIAPKPSVHANSESLVSVPQKPASRVQDRKVNQEELQSKLKQLKTDWYAQRIQLKNMMFDDNNWQAERKKIQDLKRQHPIQVSGDFPTTVPRIIAEKTMMPREEQDIEQYHTLYKEIVHCPPEIMDEMLQQLKGKKLHTMQEYAAYALLMANKHHLLAQFCQDNTNSDGLSEYITLKINRLARKDKDLEKVTSDIEKVMMRELQEARHEKVEKREKFNRTLDVDTANDPHIKQLVSSGFELIPVTVELCTASKFAIKQKQWSSNHKVVSKNSIIIDAATQKVLGIVINDAVSQQDIQPIMTSFKGQQKSLWEKDSRKGMLGEKREATTTVNEGNQATFGRLNFLKKKNNLSTTTQRSSAIWNTIKPLSKKMKVIFQHYLPRTFQTVLTQTEELRSAGLFIEPDSPFATVTLNLKNAVKPHRDHNFHNYATMLVYEKDGIESNALTCFPEWTCIDPVTRQPQDIAFQLGNLSVLIADTDYVHYVPEVLTQRVSMVWYAYKDLMTPSFLLCEDSDLEDDDYEQDNEELEFEPEQELRPKKKAKMKAKTSAVDRDSKDGKEMVEQQKIAMTTHSNSATNGKNSGFLSESQSVSQSGSQTGSTDLTPMEDEESSFTIAGDSDIDMLASTSPQNGHHPQHAGAAPKSTNMGVQNPEALSSRYALAEGGFVTTFNAETAANHGNSNVNGSHSLGTGFSPSMLPSFTAMPNTIAAAFTGQSSSNSLNISLKRKRQ